MIITRNYQMIQELKKAELYANSDHPVLITGESGTGKELFAKEIHSLSNRKHLITVNCSAIPPELVESEFFGHKKGAFTGAYTNKKGLFLDADGGTLFLDEISTLPLNLQSKLLRVIQEGTVRPVGSNTEIKINVRIISATNVELENNPNFRQDLYYRLNVLPIHLPPLRERKEDIKVLLDFFSERESCSLKFTVDTLSFLKQYKWPGNVRELENLVKRLSVTHKDRKITLSTVKSFLNFKNYHTKQKQIYLKDLENFHIVPLDDYIKEYLELVLTKCKWNVTKASKYLKVNRSTLHTRLRKYGITRSE